MNKPSCLKHSRLICSECEREFEKQVSEGLRLEGNTEERKLFFNVYCSTKIFDLTVEEAQALYHDDYSKVALSMLKEELAETVSA